MEIDTINACVHAGIPAFIAICTQTHELACL